MAKIPPKSENSSVGRWAARLPLASILSTLLPPNVEDVANITREQADEIVRIFSKDVVDILLENVASLKMALSHDKESHSNSKFGTFQGNFGTIQSFHMSIYDDIGNPNPQWEVAMRKEHENKTEKFRTGNYGIETCPSDEWRFVVDGDSPSSEAMIHGRTLLPIEHYMALALTTRASLTRPEVIALVLYTGPMFMIWNTILRKYPADLFDKLKSEESVFPTSIFVLMSAIQKVSRVMEMEPGQLLYRGVDGSMTFPPHFTSPDANGCVGMMEHGFMSTTADIDVAISYSGVDKGKAFPKVFEIRVGSVDRGADIHEFSQYPAEREYLWVPHAFLEPLGGNEMVTTPHGLVEVIKVRCNSNLKAVTVEEYQARKKDMHISSFKIQLQDLEHELAEMAFESDKECERKQEFDDFIDKCMEQSVEICTRHSALSADEFNDDHIYRALVSEMLESKKHALMKMEKLISFSPENTFDYDRQIWVPRALKNVYRIRMNELMQDLNSNPSQGATLDLLEKFDLTNDVPNPDFVDVRALNANNALVLCKRFGLVQKDIGELNDLGETPLIAACADGITDDKLELLIEAGCDVNASVSYEGDNQYKDMTPLLIASYFGRSTQVSILAKHGARLDDVAKTGDDFHNMGAMYLAAWNGHVTTIQALSHLGVNKERPDSAGFTPLLTAAYYNRALALEALSKLGADINARTNNGWSAALVAADANHTATLEMLHKLGVDLNAALDGLTPLWRACSRGHVAAVQTLLRCEADASIRYQELTPLQVAEEWGYDKIIEVFKSAGL